MKKETGDAADLSRALIPHDVAIEPPPRQRVVQERVDDPMQENHITAVTIYKDSECIPCQEATVIALTKFNSLVPTTKQKEASLPDLKQHFARHKADLKKKKTAHLNQKETVRKDQVQAWDLIAHSVWSEHLINEKEKSINERKAAVYDGKTPSAPHAMSSKSELPLWLPSLTRRPKKATV